MNKYNLYTQKLYLEGLVEQDAYVLGVIGTAAMTGQSSGLIQDGVAHLFVLHVRNLGWAKEQS